MFWKYNFGSSAQIETLLQKEDVTLSELMDEDELLQECKAQNRKLIDFLTRAEVLDELVYLVVNEPSVDSDLKIRFKYANLAAELLTADVPAIIDKLVASTSLLDVLYRFLKQEKPLNPLLASFFSKVLGMLVQRRSEQNWYSYQFTCFQVLDFLKSKGDFVELAVCHVGTSAIMDLLLRLICNVEEDEIRQSVHQWLNECQLVERLVGRLSPDADPDEHSSADNILCEISTTCRDSGSEGQPATNPLLATLESEEMINKMLDLLLHEERNESSLSHAINVLLTLLAARSPLQLQPHNIMPQLNQQQQQQQQQQQEDEKQYIEKPQGEESQHQDGSSMEGDVSSVEKRRNVVARTIAKRLPSLHEILLHPPKKGLLLTAYGAEVEPLGSTRLQVVTLVAALVAANDPIVHEALYQLNTVQYLMDLFFRFMLNNFLHTQVVQCLTAIISHAPPPTSPQSPADHHLLTQLFSQCCIIQQILAAYEETTESQDGKQLHNLRGYMGHLRQVANTIIQQAEFGPNEHRIKQLIQELPGDTATQWDDFVSNALAEVNRKNEITPLPVHGIHHQLESDDDSDDVSHFYPQSYDNGLVKKGFKEMDMDVIGDFRYADDEFKDPDDNLSGPLQRLTTQSLAVSGSCGTGGSQGVEGGGEAVVEDQDLFEELCSARCPDPHLEDIWTDVEKQITFTQPPSSEKAEEAGGGSSSEEDEEEDFSSLRAVETKMEVDQDDWAEVFDKRGGGDESGSGTRGEPNNPWQSAPQSDTSDNSGWADFGAFSSCTSSDPFDKPSFTPVFSNVFRADGRVPQDPQGQAVFSENLPSQSSNQEAFKADFSSVNFDAAFEVEGEGQKPPPTSTTPTNPQTSDQEGDESEGKTSTEEKVKEKEEEKEEEDLADNFNFLASRGLMLSSGGPAETEDTSSSSSSKAGSTDTSQDCIDGSQQPKQEECKGETTVEPTTES